MNGNWATLVFYLLAAVAVLMALGVVFARNPVHSALFLVISFLNVAGIYVMLGAEFLAAVQVIVYSGAILVLFLFVIMLVRPENLKELRATPPIQLGLSWLLGLALFLELGSVITTGIVTGQRDQYTPARVAQFGGNTQTLGRVLYSEYLLPFEAASLVLLVAVIAAIVLGIPERVAAVNTVRNRRTISLAHPTGTDLIDRASQLDAPAVAAPDLGVPGAIDTERVPSAGTGRTEVTSRPD